MWFEIQPLSPDLIITTLALLHAYRHMEIDIDIIINEFKLDLLWNVD